MPIPGIIVAAGAGAVFVVQALVEEKVVEKVEPIVEKTVQRVKSIVEEPLGDAAAQAKSFGTQLNEKSAALASSAGRAALTGGTFLRQKWGTIAFWSAATSSGWRKHMPNLYRQQQGIDALCGIPLPNLYVGPLWKRRLNPRIEVDHILPRSKGGSNELANLQLTHQAYNRAKRDLYGPELSRAIKNVCRLSVNVRR